jgi:PAS domain S-box-containing protein
MSHAADYAAIGDVVLLASVLEESPLAIDIKDRDGHYLRVSHACAALLGLRRPQDAVGHTAADFLSVDGARATQVDEQAVMRTGRPIVDVERREVDAQGRVAWWLISRQPLRDGGGEIVGTVGITRDITQRKLTDDALLSSNERLKRVIATQRELAASALDLHAVTQVVAERARELTGADGATVCLVDGDDLLARASSGAAIGLAARRPIEGGVEMHALRNGRPLLLREVAKDPRVPGGAHGVARSLVCAPFFHGGVGAGTVEVFVTGSDHALDEHDRNTVALLAQMLSTALSQAAEFTAKRMQVETLARFEATFQGAPIGIVMVTADRAIVACNPAFNALVSYTGDELASLTLDDLIEDPDAERFEALMAGALDHFRVERRFRRRAGEPVWGDASFALVRDAAGDPSFAVAMVQDVSARKRAEAERDRMETELRLAQKLESIGQLAAGIAHEINTPIQFVGDTLHFLGDAFADLMTVEEIQRRLRAAADGLVDPALLTELDEATEHADVEYLRERVPVALERGRDGIDRVASIVSAMRAFAHPSGAGFTPADLNEAVRNTLVVARGE